MPSWLEQMPPWLIEAVIPKAVGFVLLEVMATRLVVAFLLGCIAAAIYHVTTRALGRQTNTPFLATMVLLSVLIALVTMLIGENVALAFSLVGTLAIVRFRTVVEDTRDTTFVIFAVAVGMASGVGYPAAAAAVMPLVLVAAWLFRTRQPPPEPREAILVLRLGTGQEPDGRLRELLERHLPGHRLTGLATARGGAALDMTYRAGLPSPETALALVGELSRLEGVQGVELKER
jgi:uncharacterized membrane protein YhiD involved in acid resistance